MRKRALLAFCTLMATAAPPASACRIYTPGADLSVIHRAMPETLQDDLFVAEVQFDHPDAGWRELLRGTRARVLRVIQGRYRGNFVIVRDAVDDDEIRIICYPPIRDGGRGFILGRPLGLENGELVIKPLFEGRGRPR